MKAIKAILEWICNSEFWCEHLHDKHREPKNDPGWEDDPLFWCCKCARLRRTPSASLLW